MTPANADAGATLSANAAPFMFTITSYQRYSAIRAGNDQEIAIVVCKIPGKFRRCPDFGSPKESPFVPLELRLESRPEFAIRYWRGDGYRLNVKGNPIDAGGYQALMLIKLHATESVTPGAYVLKGRITWLIGDQGPGGVWKGNGVLRETGVRVPITVVQHDARVRDTDDWPTRRYLFRDVKSGLTELLREVPVAAGFWALCRIDGCE